MAGLTEDDLGGGAEIWPENLRSYELFNALATQWRIGMGGQAGLDYNVVPVVLRLQGVPRAEWPELFADVRVMEAAALQAMRE
ncbi:DUF1799 domain-containing protein [Massilia sp. X63]|uniref:DUF1799 domain-containing protein n=1 Tax=Massilia sp. X63 TaxID=3237285 RepID=UPI0034DCFBA7